MIGAFAIVSAYAFTSASIVITISTIVVAFDIACASIVVVVIVSTFTPIASIVIDFNVVALLLLLFSCCYCFY